MRGRAGLIEELPKIAFKDELLTWFKSWGISEKMSCAMKRCLQHNKPFCNVVWASLARFRNRSWPMAFVECSWWSTTRFNLGSWREQESQTQAKQKTKSVGGMHFEIMLSSSKFSIVECTSAHGNVISPSARNRIDKRGPTLVFRYDIRSAGPKNYLSKNDRVSSRVVSLYLGEG